MKDKITYTLEDANLIIRYLGTKPYEEVSHLIQTMQKGWIQKGGDTAPQEIVAPKEIPE